jgi:hypothetical protein
VNHQDSNGMPRELEGFSWAAFLWGGVWALVHRVWIGLLAFVPGVGFIMNIVLGLRGREWAWRAGAVPDVERFNKSQRNWVIVWLALFAFSSFSIVPALAIYGIRQYVASAKHAEALNTLPVMAKGMTVCAAQGDLPETSNWVPASLSSVSGKKYLSTPSEWQSEAGFACFKFSFAGPQYYRYRWHQATNASGQFEAEADLDGDGIAESAMQLGVHCTNDSCVVEPLLSGAPTF